MANIALTPISTSLDGLTTYYQILGSSFIEGDIYYIEITKSSKYQFIAYTSYIDKITLCNIKASVQDTSYQFPKGCLPQNDNPIVFFNNTRIWITDIVLSNTGVINLELDQLQ